MLTIDPTARPERGPLRTCVGCRTRRPSVELVRLTRRDSGSDRADRPVRIDVDGPSSGRGAWLCRQSVRACLDLATRRGAFDRAWRTRTEPGEAEHIATVLGPLMNTTADAADETTGGTDVATVGMTTGKG